MARKLLRKLRHKDPPELDITAFLNLMVVLVPFLLVSAVFSRISILELDLPAAVGEGEVGEKELNIEVIVRGDRIEVGDGEQIVMRIMFRGGGNLRRARRRRTGRRPGEAAGLRPGRAQKGAAGNQGQLSL
jgi:hypothetical protein